MTRNAHFCTLNFCNERKDGIGMELSEFGIGEGISEVIATTQSEKGEPNAAPIGIINRGGYFVRLYKSSKTLSNVLKTHKIAANVSNDAVLFVISAFKNLSREHFTRFQGFPVLRDADAWVIFKCEPACNGEDFFEFKLEVQAARVNRKGVRAINRGLNAIIEATILATRLKVNENDTKEGQKQHILRKIAYYEGIVEKCGGEREKEAMKILKMFVMR